MFKDKAQTLFPNVHFTGGSYKHASWARAGEADLDWDKKRLIMKSLKETEFPGSVYRAILKNFPNMEWLMTPEEFDSLLLVDFYHLLKGMPTTETKMRLQNPSTGNFFHRITLIPDHDVVGGIRVWILPIGNGIQIGFRYRMEPLSGETEHKKVRQKAAQHVLELEEEMSEIKEYVAQEQETAVDVALETLVKV